jgi:hypothetical protein
LIADSLRPTTDPGPAAEKILYTKNNWLRPVTNVALHQPCSSLPHPVPITHAAETLSRMPVEASRFSHFIHITRRMQKMPAKISVNEAVRLAKDALGDVTNKEMSAWIVANHGMNVQPVIVTVVLGWFLEKEILERSRLKAIEMVEQAKAESAAEKPKGRKTL